MSNHSLPFDAFTLAAVAAEMRDAALDARCQKVQQPTASDIVLSLYGRSGAVQLLISADPANCRVHPTQIRRENPINPPHFCMVCRKYLDGASLIDIAMPIFDRLLHLVFRTGDGERVQLIAELMGRNANLVLVSGAGVVRGAIRSTPAGAPRSLRPGTDYSPPPGIGDRIDSYRLADANDTDLSELPSDARTAREWLCATFSGIGRFAAAEILARTENDRRRIREAFVELIASARDGQFDPHAIRATPDGPIVGVWPFAARSIPAECQFAISSLSTSLDTIFANRVVQVPADAERIRLSKALGHETAYRQRAMISAAATRDAAQYADVYEAQGNTLLTYFQDVPHGSVTVDLPDPYDLDGKSVTIPLDPTLDARGNADRFFARAHKSRAAAEYAADRMEGLAEAIAALAAMSDDLKRDADGRAIARVTEGLTRLVGNVRLAGALSGSPGNAAKSRALDSPFAGHKIRTFTVDGYQLLIGESAEANDYLTTRVAAPSDLWMHVRAKTGAHGVLRTNGKPDRVADETIRRAASMVASRSGTSVKHATLVAVDVVEKRYVRKPRGAPAGSVICQRERVYDVTPMPA